MGKKKTKEPQDATIPPITPEQEEAQTLEVSEAQEVQEAQEPEQEEKNYETLYNQTLDRYQRNLAEFDNFRKRTAKEMATRYDDGLRSAAEKLLPIIDNFDRAMAASENKEDNFYQGIALIARQFDGMLSDIGVEPLADEPGSDFDHNIHHAVARIEDDAYGQNVIVEVLQKGYKHKDRVLRPSMVKTAN